MAPDRRSGPARVVGVVAALALMTAAACGIDGEAGEVDWGYEGETGPDAWFELDPSFATCGTGRAQSPVDLVRLIEDDQPIIEADYTASPARIVDNGHTVKVTLDDGGTLRLSGTVYTLLQFHFHLPSEHTVDGDPRPMEMHLVHQAADESLAVIGVFLVEGASNDALAPAWAVMPPTVDAEVALAAPFDPATLLPESLDSARYTGSLTTPPCSEGVSWIVLHEPIEVSREQITAFRNRHDGNARPTQPVHERRPTTDKRP